MNIPESSLANLRHLGYTEDEARFLYVVATQSGYFTIRQFLEFTGTKSGDKSMAFSQKLLRKGHATARSFLRNGRVYHLFSRTLYRASGRENLRNRRAHSPEHIRTRLVALDFVLAHLEHAYLETEADKLNYFCEQLAIPKQFLPAKRYAGAIRNKKTERYFVDKFPMFLSSRSPSPPVVTFTFIDPGLASLDSFTTHLGAYRTLFEALSEVRLVYIASRPTHFEAARKVFLATADRPPKREPSEEFLHYFRLQKLWDQRECGRLSKADIEFLNLAEKRYARHPCQERYARWRDGCVSDDLLRSEFRDLAPPRSVVFESALVDGQAALFDATRTPRPPRSNVIEVKNNETVTFGAAFRSVFAAGEEKPMEK